MNQIHKHRFTGILIILMATLGLVPSVGAFLDEIASLKEELQTYQQARASNINDFVDKLEVIASPAFQDVPEDAWFYAYVSSVAQWGIVSGYKDEQGMLTGLYGPSAPVTIAEVLKMALKAAQIDEMLCTHAEPIHQQAVGHWASRLVACAESRKLRLFSSGQEPDLNRPATRAEVVTLINDAFADDIPPIYTSFTDVAGHAYEADIAFASSRGIVSGDTGADGKPLGSFRPNDSINRAEVAKVMYQRVKLQVHNELILTKTIDETTKN